MYLKNITKIWGLRILNKINCAGSASKSFLLFLAKRTQSDAILRVAASLSYTSLIAIVPLFAIGLAIFSAFPVFSGIKDQFQEFIIQNFVPNIGQEITQYFTDFLNASAQLTTIGVIGLALTAILMLSTIENSLNFIFKVYKPRSIKTKITLYWTVITLGPLLLGTTISLRGYFYTLQQFVPDILAGQYFIGIILPALVNLAGLMLLYILVPNKKVGISNAFFGALVSLFLFWILRRSFGLIIMKSATYKMLYGALATLPILLIWLYCVWAVVIFGATVTATLDEFRNAEKENKIKCFFHNQIPHFKKNKNKSKKFLQKEQN